MAVVAPYEPDMKKQIGECSSEEEIDVDPEIGNPQQQSPRHDKVDVCCPLTKKPFKEPVVHSRGVTFEKEAIMEQIADAVCYPNRALKDYLDPSTDPKVELQADSVAKKGCFSCPITSDLLRDPVIDPEGQTYERHAIINWIKEHGESPMSRNPLQIEQLYDNTTLLTVLLQEVQQADSTLNPEEIEDWKREVSRVPRADPPLSARELQQALRPPPVPNPPLSAIREALATPAVPDPTLETLQVALHEESGDELEEDEDDNDNDDPAEPLQVAVTTVRPRPATPPLLLQELQMVQQDEAEQRRLEQEADRHLNLLCQRHRTTILVAIFVFVGFIVGTFVVLLTVVNLSVIYSFLITVAFLAFCCISTGQYTLWQ